MLLQNEAELVKSNVSKWWQAGYKGKGVTVVVLDDGGRPFPHMRDYVIEPLPETQDTTTGHATSVAQVVHQVAPEARVIMLDYFGDRTKVIDWIMSHQYEIDVINCSFSSHTPDATFERLRATGIPILCSSGNQGGDHMNYPALYPWTISIGSFWEHNNGVAYYSNADSNLDAVSFANIYIPNSEGKAFGFDGTSSAAPFASGMLALYIDWRKQRGFPRLTAEEARQFIKENTKDYYGKGHDPRSGYGLFVLPYDVEPYRMKIEVFIGKDQAIKDGCPVQLYVAPFIRNDRTMIGLRDVAELLGLNVSWDEKEQKVTIEGGQNEQRSI